MRLAILAFVLIWSAGCGGSASETPPPVPPSRVELAADAARRREALEQPEEGASKRRVTSLPEMEPAAEPAPRTWGGDKAVRLK